MAAKRKTATIGRSATTLELSETTAFRHPGGTFKEHVICQIRSLRQASCALPVWTLTCQAEMSNRCNTSETTKSQSIRNGACAQAWGVATQFIRGAVLIIALAGSMFAESPGLSYNTIF